MTRGLARLLVLAGRAGVGVVASAAQAGYAGPRQRRQREAGRQSAADQWRRARATARVFSRHSTGSCHGADINRRALVARSVGGKGRCEGSVRRHARALAGASVAWAGVRKRERLPAASRGGSARSSGGHGEGWRAIPLLPLWQAKRHSVSSASYCCLGPAPEPLPGARVGDDLPPACPRADDLPPAWPRAAHVDISAAVICRTSRCGVRIRVGASLR